jgi:uncharacterized protein (TIGR03437 family)
MRRLGAIALLVGLLAVGAGARHATGDCGTSRETSNQSLFLHRQAVRARKGAQPRAAMTAVSGDIGNIAIIADSNGVVDRLNQFNLDGSTLAFAPAGATAARYSYAVNPLGYDAAAAAAGLPQAALDDDDTRRIDLPFTFPFFGASYNQVWVNSDGNLTFTAGDSASTQRSLGRMTAGPPRIAPLFEDLNPGQTAGGVRVLAEAARVVVSWVKVPEYSSTGAGTPQTFQVKLYPDGRIEFSYSGASPGSAVVGISPGNLTPPTTLVDFASDPSASYTSTIAEIFGNTLAVDLVAAAQQFYQTHEDAYDYLVVYNNLGIPALGEGTVAYEQTVRSVGTGYGVPVQDSGQEFGSASRLHAVLNLGPLSQYPTDPSALVAARAAQDDTPLTILAHETGHLFLAFASIPGSSDPSAPPMLGFQLAHWSFLFDSEASVMEGERIADRPSATPRFLTTDVTQGYAPLDQYLMGFRPASAVPGTFVVNNPSPSYPATQHQLSGVGFGGARQDIAIGDVIQAMGRRTPDSTVAQRHFRFAFLLVCAAGTQAPAAAVAQIDEYRKQFEAYFAQAASGNATADTTLRRSLRLSLSPAAGVMQGASANAAVTLQTPPFTDLTVQLQAPEGNVTLPASVTIRAGTVSAAFSITGAHAGVEEVEAVPSDASYETAFARVQVADGSVLKLVQAASTSGIAVQLTDANHLTYAGIGIVAAPSADGVVVPAEAFTDSQGTARFQWTPGPSVVNHLRLTVDGLAGVSLTLSAGSAVPVISSVVNAASLEAGIAPGALEMVSGGSFTGGKSGAVKASLNGSAVPVLASSDTQIEIYVPEDVATGTGTLAVTAPSGVQSTTTVTIAPVAPGIFSGGVLRAGTGLSASTNPVRAGDFLEIYCTGLGPSAASGTLRATVMVPTVFIGAVPLHPVFSGLAPGLTGVYQVDVQVPGGLAPGAQPVLLSIDQAHSNAVNIMVQ